jgi:hypothetical protein
MRYIVAGDKLCIILGPGPGGYIFEYSISSDGSTLIMIPCDEHGSAFDNRLYRKKPNHISKSG